MNAPFLVPTSIRIVLMLTPPEWCVLIAQYDFAPPLNVASDLCRHIWSFECDTSTRPPANHPVFGMDFDMAKPDPGELKANSRDLRPDHA
jgi:hypothetical protein